MMDGKVICLTGEEMAPYLANMLASGDVPEDDREAISALMEAFQQVFSDEQKTSESEQKTSESKKKKKSRSKKNKAKHDTSEDSDRKLTEAEYEEVQKKERSVNFFLLFLYV